MKECFKDKVVVVTGGSSGMGKTAALRFAELGAKVAITADKNISGAEETVRQIEAMGGEAFFMQCDVSVNDQVAAFFEQVDRRWGRLDVAFNNAGIGVDVPAPIYEMPEEVWDRVIAVDLKGPFLCLKYESIYMKRYGNGGAIVNNASAGAVKPMPGDSCYAAAKRGLVSLTITTAIEVGQFGIRVNCICPSGITGTNLTKGMEANPEAMARIKQMTPLGRIGDTEDVADVVLWLSSPYSRHITGEVMCIDGGILKR